MPLRVGPVRSPMGVETLGFGCTARRTRSFSLSRPLPATSTQVCLPLCFPSCFAKPSTQTLNLLPLIFG
jgi:hypothetical protein